MTIGALPVTPRVAISKKAPLAARRVAAKELLAAHFALLEAAGTGALAPKAAASLSAYAWRARSVARGLAESVGDVGPPEAGDS
jgi:hypothetical protein